MVRDCQLGRARRSGLSLVLEKLPEHRVALVDASARSFRGCSTVDQCAFDLLALLGHFRRSMSVSGYFHQRTKNRGYPCWVIHDTFIIHMDNSVWLIK